MQTVFMCEGEEIANLDIKTNYSLSRGQGIVLKGKKYVVWQIETEVIELNGETSSCGDCPAIYKTVVYLDFAILN